MINPLLLLTGDPIRVNNKIQVFQPTIKDLAILGNEKFGSLSSVWFLKRKELIPEENDHTWNLSDFEVWKESIIFNPILNQIFKESVMFFLHNKVEFMKIQHTIMIGELSTGIELQEDLFIGIRDTIGQVVQRKEDETKKKPSTKKAEKIQAMIDKGEAKIKEIKKSKGIDPLALQISAFVAHNMCTYAEVFDMTLIQFGAALEKTVQIENYTLSTMLSPYMDKKHKPKNTHWLE